MTTVHVNVQRKPISVGSVNFFGLNILCLPENGLLNFEMLRMFLFVCACLTTNRVLILTVAHLNVTVLAKVMILKGFFMKL